LSLNLDQDPCAIIAVRELEAPRELVFAVWTDPEHLAQWWGPVGFTTTTSAFDLTEGGEWRFVMRMGPTAAITKIASPSMKLSRRSASITIMVVPITSNPYNFARP
jgi:Activator of Hsp90 ATPase homolog 1-like protein